MGDNGPVPLRSDGFMVDFRALAVATARTLMFRTSRVTNAVEIKLVLSIYVTARLKWFLLVRVARQNLERLAWADGVLKIYL
jgi:hypothetical protein